jgi:hypothetical protein
VKFCGLILLPMMSWHSWHCVCGESLPVVARCLRKPCNGSRQTLVVSKAGWLTQDVMTH